MSACPMLAGGTQCRPTPCWLEVHSVGLPHAGWRYTVSAYPMLAGGIQCRPTPCWLEVHSVGLPHAGWRYTVSAYPMLAGGTQCRPTPCWLTLLSQLLCGYVPHSHHPTQRPSDSNGEGRRKSNSFNRGRVILTR